MSGRRTPVAHPFLLALYPPLALYASGADLLLPEESWVGFSLSLGFGVATFAVVYAVFRSARKAGLITSVVIISWFSYGHVFELVDAVIEIGLKGRYVIPLWVLASATVIVWIARSNSTLVDATRILNIAAAVLVIMPAVSLAAHFARTHEYDVAEQFALPISELIPVGPARSVYFLVFDRYGSQRVLSESYGFDNSPFLDQLRARGFYVASRSASNYLRTGHSLASSLNMQYLDRLAAEMGPDSSDTQPLRALMQDHEVGRLLHGAGYRYVHLGSWWDPTRMNRNADENLQIHAHLNEFTRTLLRSSLFWPITRRTRILAGVNNRDVQCRRVKLKFERLKEIASSEEVLFVFAHILSPHWPYVVDAQGNCMSKAEERLRDRRTNYVGQVEFLNGEILKLVDTLLRRSEVAPIIIIQADEGPFPARIFADEKLIDWRDTTPDELREKTGILNALLLPGVEAEGLHPSLTPVNTFRIIFNEYFGTSLPLLPDRVYAFPNTEQIYDLFEITSAVE